MNKKIKGTSIFVPASAQEKGIDLLLYKYTNGVNTTNTIQVIMSRAYYDANPRYQGILWFNRFKVPENANWCIFVGIFAGFSNDVANAKSKDTKWNTIMLAFTNKEMQRFMDEVKLKGDPNKVDKMFGFGFIGKSVINQTRGYSEERDMTKYLIENRIAEIGNSFI